MWESAAGFMLVSNETSLGLDQWLEVEKMNTWFLSQSV